MKNFKRKISCLAICLALSLSVVGCGAPTRSSVSSSSKQSASEVESVQSSEVESVVDYQPSYFTADKTEIVSETLADGAIHKSVPITLTNGNTSVVHVIEADLTKVSINAGTKDNAVMSYDFTKTTPYDMSTAWSKATGGTVYASINADFFGTYCVNAFVKDGYVIKNGHNDNSEYDYTNTSSDVPASAPMLFGVKGDTAQIAPIVSYDGDVTSKSVKRTLIRSKLTYSLTVSGTTLSIGAGATPTISSTTFCGTSKGTLSSGLVLKVDTSEGLTNMKVLDKTEVSTATDFSPKADRYGYIFAGSKSDGFTALQTLNTGDEISLTVSSEDHLWDGYDTILGCRQALVIDGAVADTVTLENTNGAQRTDVPRTAVGLKDSHTVCLFAVESMRYGGKGTSSDTYGLNLPELADFICWYGCKQAANFDGGGSTQLILNGGSYATPTVVVRSSDTGSTSLTSTRNVMNAFLITSKTK